jgi:hypothetical protein
VVVWGGCSVSSGEGSRSFFLSGVLTYALSSLQWVLLQALSTLLHLMDSASVFLVLSIVVTRRVNFFTLSFHSASIRIAGGYVQAH